MVKPNSLGLLHINPLISVETSSGGQFLCFATLQYEFSGLNRFFAEKDVTVKWCFREFPRLSDAGDYFCFHEHEQGFSLFLNYAVISNSSCNCWRFDLKGPGTPNELNTRQWFRFANRSTTSLDLRCSIIYRPYKISARHVHIQESLYLILVFICIYIEIQKHIL